MAKQDVIEIKGSSVPSARLRLDDASRKTSDPELQRQLLNAHDLLDEQLSAGNARQAVYLEIKGGSLTARIGEKEITQRITGAQQYTIEHIIDEQPDGRRITTSREVASGRNVKVEKHEVVDATESHRQDPSARYSGMSGGYGGGGYQTSPTDEVRGYMLEPQPLIFDLMARILNKPEWTFGAPVRSIGEYVDLGGLGNPLNVQGYLRREVLDWKKGAGKIVDYIDCPKMPEKTAKKILHQNYVKARKAKWGSNQ